MSTSEPNLEPKPQSDDGGAPRVRPDLALVTALFVLFVAGAYFAGLYLIIR